MDQWRDFPLPDGSYSDATRPWAQQDVCNYLPTIAEQSGTRSRIKYACAPGLQTFATVGTGPHRGAHNVEGKFFVVSGEGLYQVFVTGNSDLKGTIPGTAKVSMTHNQIDGGNELLIGTGDSSYVYNTTTGQLHQNDNVPLQSVDFLNQLCLGVDVGRRFWRYSGLADARTWNTLDNESAESSPDLILGLKVSQGEVVVFGKRTAEVWSNSPTEDTAFVRSTVIEKGCASADSIQRLDNSLFWLGDDGIVYRLQGYQPVPISPKALTATFLDSDLTRAISYTYEDNGYVIYYLTFPNGQTWGYDVTSQRWHRRESFGLDRWRLNTLTHWWDGWYGGDYSSGKVYKLTWGSVYEGCEIMPRSIRSGVLHNNGNRVFLHGLRLNLQSGGQASTAGTEDPPSISGNLPGGTVGDSVDYQYTITPAYAGQDVSLSVSGNFPPGLTLADDGTVTGTLTTGGTFVFQITPSSSCAEGAPLSDSSTILDPFGAWWLTTSNPDNVSTVWESSDLTGPWSAGVERTPNVAYSDYGPVGAGLDNVLIAGYNADFELIQDFDPTGGYATTTKTLAAGIDTVRHAGGYTFAFNSSSPTYWVSSDHGATWASRTSFGTRWPQDIARLDSGRWIAFVADGADSRFVYSDDPDEPTNWTNSTVTPTQNMSIATNGTVACGVAWSGGVMRTTDGAIWTQINVPGIFATNVNIASAAFGDVFVMCCNVPPSSGGWVRSTDAGLTWDVHDGVQIRRFETDGSVIVQCFSPGESGMTGAKYSADFGDTWVDVEMPYSTSGGDIIAIGRVRYST